MDALLAERTPVRGRRRAKGGQVHWPDGPGQKQAESGAVSSQPECEHFPPDVSLAFPIYRPHPLARTCVLSATLP